MILKEQISKYITSIILDNLEGRVFLNNPKADPNSFLFTFVFVMRRGFDLNYLLFLVEGYYSHLCGGENVSSPKKLEVERHSYVYGV
jgi:hypothetical protein